MPNSFVGKAGPLSRSGFDDAVKSLGADSAGLWALLTVETRGFGYLADRRPKILFERHIFRKRSAGRFDAAQPDLSAATPGGYLSGAAEYGRLERAMLLDRKAALESASWGLPQIMGYNAVSIGYESVERMVEQFLESEDNQLVGAVRFLSANPPLAKAFRGHDWQQVAFFYNGEAYAKNNYHIKLEQYYEVYAAKHVPDIDVRAMQARLLYLGYDPRGVDGVLGTGARTALLAFQKAAGLPPTGQDDEATRRKLVEAAGV